MPNQKLADVVEGSRLTFEQLNGLLRRCLLPEPVAAAQRQQTAEAVMAWVVEWMSDPNRHVPLFGVGLHFASDLKDLAREAGLLPEEAQGG